VGENTAKHFFFLLTFRACDQVFISVFGLSVSVKTVLDVVNELVSPYGIALFVEKWIPQAEYVGTAVAFTSHDKLRCFHLVSERGPVSLSISSSQITRNNIRKQRSDNALVDLKLSCSAKLGCSLKKFVNVKDVVLAVIEVENASGF